MSNNLQEFLFSIFDLTQEENTIFREAMTHSSNGILPNNQRLAFLGDSVLKLIISEYFYRKHPDWSSGKLTKLCGEEIESNKNFANIAIKLELVKYMAIKNPPPACEANETLNAEALEALFGAIYLSRGFEETKRIALKYIIADVELFKDDDAGYLEWINSNTDGFVVNCNRQPNPNYLYLHLASCSTISGIPANGKSWTFDYIKVCSLDQKELEKWVQQQVGGKLKHCSTCRP